MSLAVREMYGHATLQGLPVLGYRRFGVPPGGAFDKFAHAVANGLVGNPLGATGLELGMASGRFATSADLAIAVTGARCRIYVDGAEAEPWTSIFAPAGSEFRIEQPQVGARSFLAVSAGLEPAAKPLQIVGMGLVRANQALETGELSSFVTRRFAERNSLHGPLRCLPGPQATDDARRAMESREFAVDHRSDRVGIRLDGPALAARDEIVSEPACPGAVQIANSGQLAILGPDGPTIGGYTKPAVVCSADMSRLAQLRPGERVRFRFVEPEEADRLAVESVREIEGAYRTALS